VVGLVSDDLGLLAVGPPHVREEGAALRELFPAVLAEGPVVDFDPLVDDPLVLLEGAPQHALPAVRAGHGDLGLDVHVHNPQVARQLRFAVEAALTELTVKPGYLLVNHSHVFR